MAAAKRNASTRKGKLTPKQAAFVREYLKDNNATQASIRAGYSKKTAEWIGPQLLTKSHVRDELTRRQEKLQKKTDWTVERLIENYNLLLQRALGCKEEGITYYFDLTGATKVLDSIAKTLGLNAPEKKELTAILMRPDERVQLLDDARAAKLLKAEERVYIDDEES